MKDLEQQFEPVIAVTIQPSDQPDQLMNASVS